MAEKAQLSALERLEKLESDCKNLMQSLVGVAQSSELTAQRALGTEHSMAALGKMFGAVVKQLKNKNVIDDEQIMDTIREDDDNASRKQIGEMIKSGFIAAVGAVDETSMVVVTQDLIDLKTSTTKKISGFRTVEMPSPGTPSEVKKDLLGRKVGDKFETKAGDADHTVIVTVTGIYNIAEAHQQGEEVPAQSDSGATPTADATQQTQAGATPDATA